MKKDKIVYWSTTILIFLFEGVMPAFTSQTELAKQGISHLGYPLYFGNALVVFKVLGTLLLIIPAVPKKLKELAYAGFIFDFVFASISHFVVDGLGYEGFVPLVVLAVLMVSYTYFHKLQKTAA
jgi:DoxX-like family